MHWSNEIEVYFSLTEQPEFRLAGGSPPCCPSGPRFLLSCFSTVPYGGLCLPDPSWMSNTLMFWVPGRRKRVAESHPFLKVPAHKWPISLLFTFHYQECSHTAALTPGGRGGGWEIPM